MCAETKHTKQWTTHVRKERGAEANARERHLHQMLDHQWKKEEKKTNSSMIIRCYFFFHFNPQKKNDWKLTSGYNPKRNKKLCQEMRSVSFSSNHQIRFGMCMSKQIDFVRQSNKCDCPNVIVDAARITPCIQLLWRGKQKKNHSFAFLLDLSLSVSFFLGLSFHLSSWCCSQWNSKHMHRWLHFYKFCTTK